MIKVAAILDNQIKVGGGFNQALNAIAQMQRLSQDQFIFEVLTTNKENISLLNRLGIEAFCVRISILDKILIKLSQNNLWQSLQSRLKIIGSLEKKLLYKGFDLVYFVTPSNLCLALQKINYIATLWDLCHRENPEFPEVRNFGEFFSREKAFRNIFGPALVTLTESNSLANMASQYYGIERNRFLAMPLTPSPFLSALQSTNNSEVLEKYRIKSGYFFYPAQFWAHKNHMRILQALVALRQRNNWFPVAVFSGTDCGNKNHVINFVKNNNLESQVIILGFVPPEDMRALYENSIAVVMPTYFGPTNLPPLEAWSLGIPLIYSAQLASHAGNAALLVDPDSIDDLVNAMKLCKSQELRSVLIKAGYQQLDNINQHRKNAEIELLELIKKFTLRRGCWT